MTFQMKRIARALAADNPRFSETHFLAVCCGERGANSRPPKPNSKQLTREELGTAPLGYQPPNRETDGGMSLAPKGFADAVRRHRRESGDLNCSECLMEHADIVPLDEFGNCPCCDAKHAEAYRKQYSDARKAVR